MREIDDFETQVRTIAAGMQYPRTPDVASAVAARLRPATRPRFRLASKAAAWSLTILLVLCSSLMLIPPARAAIIEFIQIGIVRIFPGTGEPTPVPTPTPTPFSGAPVTGTPFAIAPRTATPAPPASGLPTTLSQIMGLTTLASAQDRVNYSILLPAYPPNLGDPDHVFVQEADGSMTILVWLDPQQPDEVLMSLHFIPAGSWAIDKAHPQLIEETSVNGRRALWVVGPYPLRLYNGDLDFTRLVDGHVLIWTDGDITYRLESNLNLQEAIKVAESLQSIP